NHRDGTLIDLRDFSSIQVNKNHAEQETPNQWTQINLINQKDDPFHQLLDKFPSLSDPSFKTKDVSHGIKHYIPTECNPIQSRARKLSPEKLEIAKQEFEKLCSLGICHRGKSEWASPLMVAPKPGGGWRVCGDYRRLNNATIDDKYPVKAISDFNANLAGKTIFSKIDLLKGYHQIPVNPADIPKTAVITPFGLFIFPRTPFGLKNAGQDFQRLMDAILGDLPFCFVYIDDILVASSSPAEHLRHLEEIFTILDANGLVVNQAKCVLGKTSLEFLGYRVDKHGIAPLPERIEAIRSCKAPTTVKELQRFLGMINYYRRFIPKAAKHLFHLFEALSSKPKVLEWNPDREKSFQAIKEALAKTTMLRHPRPEANLALTTDASDLAIGAVLEQRGPKGWEPLGFYSMKLNASQRKWPTFDRELLAAFRGIRHFRYMLEGRTFTIYT
ncbi:MAG: reverse transcriptase family protein, partial [Bacteroidota bacterium]